MVFPSHDPCRVVSNVMIGPLMCPVESRRTVFNDDGYPDAPEPPREPLAFHVNHVWPVAGSTDGDGSMLPAGSTSQYNGRPRVMSRNGPSGPGALATVRQ